ncbi:hypothetical protein SAP2_00330 [Staphylococcus arlettae]|uniref:hypothetical protein n=1 Tax=unclassified Staphylococcus TaxID=91994 RepID=UPI001136507B|nr:MULTISPECIES: hypothetical protein [unclassified Staphylococcus]UXR80475.1 hypothetical protein MUA65_00205 [Staphylococcus sp. IVB6218]UXR82538.1 hypothetical protein MUA51_00175 [Staphylococcus sp. IVB6214]BBK26849.1 hypothetical protein SAP2_00330 [Staphylococcus arlettae]
MELKFKQTESNKYIFLGYIFDYCRESLKTLDINKSLNISIKRLSIEDNFREYVCNGVVIHISDEDIKSIIKYSNPKVAYKLLIRRVLDALYDALEDDLNKETKLALWNNFERSTLDFFKLKFVDKDMVTLPKMMFEYDYMGKYLMKDIEKKKLRMQRHTEINRSFGDSFTPSFFDFSGQTIIDHETDRDGIQELFQNFISGDIQKITKPQLPKSISLIDTNEEANCLWEYKPESIFALHNIMEYFDKKFYTIVNENLTFDLSDVKDFATDDINSSNQEAIGNGAIYNKFNPQSFVFHEFVIISAIANFYKNPYLKMINMGKFSSQPSNTFNIFTKDFNNIPLYMSDFIIKKSSTFADDLIDFIWVKLKNKINKSKQQDVAYLIEKIFSLSFTPLNTKKHYNAVQSTYNITQALISIINDTSNFNNFINYENLINNVIDLINDWIEQNNHFVQQMESDIASLNLVSDNYYLDILEVKELDNDYNDDGLLNSIASFNLFLDNLTNKVDERLVCTLVAKTIKKV